MSGEPSVLIMARAPRPGEVRRGVSELIGESRAARLQRMLIETAARWAHEAAPGRVYVAHDPPDAAGEIRELTGEATVFPQHGEGIAGRFADAATRVLGRENGPLLTIWPELPVWRRSVAAGALEDLRTGTDVVLGPLVDGGCYLVGVNRVIEPLFAAPEAAWRARDTLRLGLEAVRGAELELGLLRSERALRRPGDVRAALADPCTGAELRETLSSRLSVSPS